MGVSGSTGVRLRAPVEGNEVTTSGSSRLFSAWSIAATKARDPRESENMGIEKTRLASLPHTEHVTDSGAVPSGRVTSNTPSCSHRYSYVATALLFSVNNVTFRRHPEMRLDLLLFRVFTYFYLECRSCHESPLSGFVRAR